jgi:hypothetical protein
MPRPNVGPPPPRGGVKDHCVGEPTRRGQGGETLFKQRHGIIEGPHEDEGLRRSPLRDERPRHVLLEGDEVRTARGYNVLEQEGDAVAHTALVPVARAGQRARQAVQEVEIDDIEGAEAGERHGQRREDTEERGVVKLSV